MLIRCLMLALVLTTCASACDWLRVPPPNPINRRNAQPRGESQYPAPPAPQVRITNYTQYAVPYPAPAIREGRLPNCTCADCQCGSQFLPGVIYTEQVFGSPVIRQVYPPAQYQPPPQSQDFQFRFQQQYTPRPQPQPQVYYPQQQPRPPAYRTQQAGGCPPGG